VSWKRIAVVATGVTVAAVGAYGVWYYGIRNVSAAPEQPSPPYFAQLSLTDVVDGLQAKKFRCDPPDPLGVTCETIGDDAMMLIARGRGPTRIESIVVRAVGSRLNANAWVNLVTAYLPPRLRDAARRWARDHVTGTRTSITRIGGYRLRLFARPESPALEISSPGAAAEPGGEPPISFGGPLGGSAEPLSPLETTTMLRELTPFLRFSRDEHFYPVDAGRYIAIADVCQAELQLAGRLPFKTYKLRKTGCVPSRSRPPQLQCREPPDRCYLAFALPDAAPASVADHLAIESRMPREFRLYWHAQRLSPTRAIVGFWFFYSYNNFVNLHEGDWEWIGIDTRLLLGGLRVQPLKVFYSAHHGGRWRPWNEMIDGINRIEFHPIVYVAKGSHANYFRARVYNAEECRTKTSGPCFGNKDYALGNQCQLGPADYGLLSLEGAGVPARFGAANYLGPRHIVTGGGPDDPRNGDEFGDLESAFESAQHDVGIGPDVGPLSRCERLRGP
jgi:hypothetical protein